MKKYKYVAPEDTVFRIKKILLELGLLLKEQYFESGSFHSCRISLANSGVAALDIGTNGKGNNFEYALASGYAELMERLQNKILLNKRIYAYRKYVERLPPDSLFVKKLIRDELIFDYKYDKSEEAWKIEKVIDSCKEDLKKFFHIESDGDLISFLKEEFGDEDITMIPFYSVFSKKLKYLPINLLSALTGSNGMAAGNTCKEAVLQGLCEIFERYAVFEIYLNKLAPPTIDTEYFRGTEIYAKIGELERNRHLDIIIKDCSLHKGLPVIGVLIIDRENHTYCFKLGADFVPYRALERCLNEVYQGTVSFKGMPLGIFDLNEGVRWEMSAADYKYYNLNRIFINGSGFWPESIFSEDYSYSFEGFNPMWGICDEKDLSYGLNVVKQLGYEVYIRDNSILGFPSYYIVIPGMSQHIYAKEHFHMYKKSFAKLDLIAKLGCLSKEEATVLADAIDENYWLIKYRSFNYTQQYLYNVNFDLLHLPLELLMCMLSYYIGREEKAKKYLDRYLIGKDKKEFSYFFALSDFLSLKIRRELSGKEIIDLLTKWYGRGRAEEVVSDMQYPERIFQYYHFPTCFDCEACKVVGSCRFFELLKIEKKLTEFTVDQERLEIELGM